MIFGSWSPDLPQLNHDGLVLARNVLPREGGGYEPVKSMSPFTFALPDTWKGGGWFKGIGGASALLAGTDAGLYLLTASAATLKHSDTYTQPWHFGQFGDLVIAVAGAAPVKYTIATAAGAALGGSPPSSSMIAIVDPGFVFLAGNSSAVSTVYWSALENPEGWTIGTDECDSQLIPDGGEITGLSGGDVCLAFQSDAIHEFRYQGGEFIFIRRKVSDGIGAICHGSIARAGRRHFFLHRSGFQMYVDGEIIPVGKGKESGNRLALLKQQCPIGEFFTSDPDYTLIAVRQAN